jgi:hypothetical protein
MLHNTKLERLGSCKHCSLLGLFLSYEENEVWDIRYQVLGFRMDYQYAPPPSLGLYS